MEERTYTSERLGERSEAESGTGERTAHSTRTTRAAIELGIERTVTAFLNLIDEHFYQWLHGRKKEDGTEEGGGEEGGGEEGGGEEGGQEASSTPEGDLDPEGDSRHPRPVH